MRKSPHRDALFGPDSLSWKLRREGGVLLALAGARAALLQLAHPKIAAGIADHSYVEADPYERVRRTGEAMASISFGSREERRATMAKLASIHRQVRGTLPSGTSYDATDPALMFFVLATLIDSNLIVEERYVGVFDEEERRRYYRERLLVSDAFGIARSEIPADIDAFRAYMDHELLHLEVGDVARRVGRLVLFPTFVRLPSPAFAMYRLILCDLLPPRIRRAYGLQEHPRLRPLRDAVQAGSRAVFPRIPRRLRMLRLRPRAA